MNMKLFFYVAFLIFLFSKISCFVCKPMEQSITRLQPLQSFVDRLQDHVDIFS